MTERDQKSITIRFEHKQYAVSESYQQLTVNVLRKDNVDAKVTVDYATREGTAIEHTDFMPTSGTLTFEEGETEKTVDICIMGDNAYEEDEDFYVILEKPQIVIEGGNSICTAVEAKLDKDFNSARITITPGGESSESS